MSYVKNCLKMDKIDRLLDAIEHPDLYTEREIEDMLSDPETSETYDLLDKARASLAPIAQPDIDAEWQAFAHSRSKRRFSIINLLSRNAAAGIAIGIASLAAVAAVVGASVNYAIDKKAEATYAGIPTSENTTAAAADTLAIADENAAAAAGTVVFDNEPFETIASRIAEHYGYSAEFTTDAPKSLRLYFRWNRAQAIEEVVESLNNFEQIHIAIAGKTLKID